MRFINKSILYLVAGAILTALVPVSAYAAEVTVTYKNAHEVFRQELKRGQRADIIVYLASFGDAVDDYPISLMNDSQTRLISTQKTDVHGIVHFKGVLPGDYFVMLRLSRKAWNQFPVKIGDVRLKVSKPRKR